MLNSTEELFSLYIDDVSRYTIHSIDMVRGVDGEDIYYLCSVGTKWYVVFETDYIGSLSHTTKEIIEAFSDKHIRPIYWLANKMIEEPPSLVSPSDSVVDNKQYRNMFVTKPQGSYLKYAILAVECNKSNNPKYNPHSYGTPS
jgi:hypothetical protein